MVTKPPTIAPRACRRSAPRASARLPSTPPTFIRASAGERGLEDQRGRLVGTRHHRHVGCLDLRDHGACAGGHEPLGGWRDGVVLRGDQVPGGQVLPRRRAGRLGERSDGEGPLCGLHQAGGGQRKVTGEGVVEGLGLDVEVNPLRSVRRRVGALDQRIRGDVRPRVVATDQPRRVHATRTRRTRWSGHEASMIPCRLNRQPRAPWEAVTACRPGGASRAPGGARRRQARPRESRRRT